MQCPLDPLDSVHTEGKELTCISLDKSSTKCVRLSVALIHPIIVRSQIIVARSHSPEFHAPVTRHSTRWPNKPGLIGDMTIQPIHQIRE